MAKQKLLAPLANGHSVRVSDIKAAPLGDLLDTLEFIGAAIEAHGAAKLPKRLKLSRRRLRDEIQERATRPRR